MNEKCALAPKSGEDGPEGDRPSDWQAAIAMGGLSSLPLVLLLLLFDAGNGLQRVPVITLRSGAHMPQIGFGTWGVSPQDVEPSVRAAIASGYRMFDLAPVYNNEAAVGQVLAALQAEGAVARSELFLTSKVPPVDACEPEQLRAKLEQTLHDLRTSYLDLYLVHWPFCVRPGAPSWPPPLEFQRGYSAEQLRSTWRGMERFVTEGKVRAIGLANIGPNRLMRLLKALDLRVAPAVVQVELHPYNTLTTLRALCTKQHIAITAYASLGSAARPTKYQVPADAHPVLLSDPVVASIASALGAPASAVALGWALRRGVAIIPKSTHPPRVRSNMEDTLRVAPMMSEKQLKRLDGLDRQHRYLAAGFKGYAWHEGMGIEELWDDPIEGNAMLSLLGSAWYVSVVVLVSVVYCAARCNRSRRKEDHVARRLSFGSALDHLSPHRQQYGTCSEDGAHF